MFRFYLLALNDNNNMVDDMVDITLCLLKEMTVT